MKRRDATDLNNYRTIAKLSTPAKMFKAHMNSQLKQFLADFSILCENQRGFRAGHSSEAAAVDQHQHCLG